MKIGFGLPNIGPLGSAEAVKKVAQRAEALGYESLWTIERLLWPVKPQTPYPVTPDGHLPDGYKYVLDPLDTLTFRCRAHEDHCSRHQRPRYPLLQPGGSRATSHHDRSVLERSSGGWSWLRMVKR